MAQAMAPSESVLQASIRGRTIDDYQFLSDTRFDWNGEMGNWSYSVNADNVGLIVFTYGEDGNDPSVYREETVLAFDSTTTGVFVSTIYEQGLPGQGGVLFGSESGIFDYPWLEEPASDAEVAVSYGDTDIADG